MSLDERTIQALRLVKETIRLRGGPTAVPLTQSMISAVSHAHSKYLSYLENEKQKTPSEAAHRKEATQTAEHMEITRKKAEDLTLPSALSMKLPVSSQLQSRRVTCRQQQLHRLCQRVETIS